MRSSTLLLSYMRARRWRRAMRCVWSACSKDQEVGERAPFVQAPDRLGQERCCRQDIELAAGGIRAEPERRQVSWLGPPSWRALSPTLSRLRLF